jgi:hypothetical protein
VRRPPLAQVAALELGGVGEIRAGVKGKIVNAANKKAPGGTRGLAVAATDAVRQRPVGRGA